MSYLFRTGIIISVTLITGLALAVEKRERPDSRRGANPLILPISDSLTKREQNAPLISPDRPVTTSVRTPALSNAGEQVKWYVVAGGGTASAGGMTITTAIGQNVAGPISSGTLKVNVGYIQSFGPPPCCTGTTGNVNMAGIVDLSDLSALVSFLTGGGFVISCTEEANVNEAGIVDLSDLSALVNYLTAGGYTLPSCA